MQTERRLLILGLSCHGPHFRLLHRRPDRPRIRRIGLVRLGSNRPSGYCLTPEEPLRISLLPCVTSAVASLLKAWP